MFPSTHVLLLTCSSKSNHLLIPASTPSPARCPAPLTCSPSTCPLSPSHRPLAFPARPRLRTPPPLPCVVSSAPARDHHFLRGSLSSYCLTCVSLCPVHLPRYLYGKHTCTCLSSTPHLSCPSQAQFLSPADSATVRPKLTASGYLVKHRPRQPSGPQGGAVSSLARTKTALDSVVGEGRVWAPGPGWGASKRLKGRGGRWLENLRERTGSL